MDAHEREHANDIRKKFEGRDVTTGQIIVFGLTGGLIPCPAAITVLPTVELSKCYVMPGHHGAGVAARLMAASLDAARARGAAAVWLGVNQENAKAQRFYAKSGFARVGTKRFLVGDRWEHDFVLERVF